MLNSIRVCKRAPDTIASIQGVVHALFAVSCSLADGGDNARMCHWSWCCSLLGKTKHIKVFQRSYVLANVLMCWWLIGDTCDQGLWDLLVILLILTLRGGGLGQFSEQSFEQDFNLSFQCCLSQKLIFQCWYTLGFAQFSCWRESALSVQLCLRATYWAVLEPFGRFNTSFTVSWTAILSLSVPQKEYLAQRPAVKEL